MRLEVFLFASLVFASAAFPDEVRLVDASIVFGRVTSVSGGNLKIATDFAGELTIPVAKIAGVIVDEPREIRIGATHHVQGTLDLDDGVQVLIVGESVQPLALHHLTVLQDLGVPIVDPPVANWVGRAEVGLTGKSGNTDRMDARALVSATRTGPHGRLTLSTRGAYAEVEDDRSQNEVLAMELYERDLTARLFAFEKLELEYDEFEDLDLRATLSAGLGYFLVRSPRQELKVRGGLAYQHEEFSDSSTEDSFLLESGYDYRLDIAKWFRYTSRLSFFAEPDDTYAWRFDAENAGEVPLSRATGWKLRFGVRHEYDNDPQPDIERLDTSYYLTLVYDWD